MSARLMRRLTLVFYLLFLGAVTWPGMAYVNRVEPLVLGLPFNMTWIAGWVAVTPVVLYLLERAEERERGEGE